MAGAKSDDDLDRELIELLNELRVALPGVQVLFAFLLAVPFQQGWQKVNDTQKYAFFVALLCAALGTVLLIAPTHWTVTLTVTGAIAVAFAWFWYALPLWRRVQRG